MKLFQEAGCTDGVIIYPGAGSEIGPLFELPALAGITLPAARPLSEYVADWQ
jgi:hypothetical protein